MRYVEDITRLGMPDADEAGGKGANMGEMVKAGLPVPPGFVVLRDSYLESIRSGGVAEELNAAHREAMLHTLDMLGVGPIDSYGDAYIAQKIGFATGSITFAAGLYAQGRWLRSETVVEVSDSMATA